MVEASYKIIKFKASELPKRYKGLVCESFLLSHRQNNKYMNMIDPDAYFKVYPAYIATLLTRPEAIIRLAVLSDDDDVVLGWCLVEPKKLHYVHVKEDQRGQKIATNLLSEPFTTFTHFTNFGLKLQKEKYPNLKFNPFA